MKEFILGFTTCMFISLIVMGVMEVNNQWKMDAYRNDLVEQNYKMRKEIRGLWRELNYERGKRR